MSDGDRPCSYNESPFRKIIPSLPSAIREFNVLYKNKLFVTTTLAAGTYQHHQRNNIKISNIDAVNGWSTVIFANKLSYRFSNGDEWSVLVASSNPTSLNCFSK